MSNALALRSPYDEQGPEVGSFFGKLGRGLVAVSTGGASEAARAAARALKSKKKKKPAAASTQYDIRKMSPAAIAAFQAKVQQTAGYDDDSFVGADEDDYIGAEVIEQRNNEVGAAVHAIRNEVFRQRIDWHWLQNGHIEAVLTVTVPDGHEFRFRAQADPKEIAATLAAMHPEVGGFLGKMWKGIKKVAKTVATSKVFKLAAGALAMAAPALGPLAPALLAAGASMKAASAMVAARTYAAKGDSSKANALISYATKASKAAATIAPPKGSARAASPSDAALKAHVDAARAASSKLFRLLNQPA